ncbi:vacuolar fusion protein CCZ1 [Purpureocillium lilacinum]|uniref:Vacuolar fusion protein CCZ1 n=1 Tax=Purpureocillium lilacinum TaxID=33203 RepID=A0A179HM47_PURLI|nr:vacuolar fusion protein CCZ1 [Purpureocillium lilacinum]OAQ90443.1 vacuolar fusion protein CCZ1 [Purpureocillium lilacinum]GJN68014.1 hypothetical protein PLICBS_002057 [Purpureocillium lilacinum]
MASASSSGPQAAAAAASASVVPAQLGFLAIYNPSLGTSDDTIDDQIVYYASVTTQQQQQQQSSGHSRRRRRRAGTRGRPTDAVSQEERHERLRQIGLAQGMVGFSRGFADGAPVDAIDTERARVVMHELEPGWWIVASVDLTKVPLPPRLATKSSPSSSSAQSQSSSGYEYSSRDMKPAALLLRDLLRAHSVFLMHHASSLSALFVHCRRSKFVAVLSRYWDLYLSTWNVMLHGNPARDMLGGINLAASGELGIGVGEEDRGSGEREVLEGLVGRIEGLVDLVVSKFGDEEETGEDQHPLHHHQHWLGTGQEPAVEDGAIFLGTGALSRKSLRDVTHWMEDLYTWGEHAYGVIESPTSVRRVKARKDAKRNDHESNTDRKQTVVQTLPPAPAPAPSQSAPSKGGAEAEEGKLDKMFSYMKLGYGSYWTLPGGGSSDSSSVQPAKPDDEAQAAQAKDSSPRPTRPSLPRRTSSAEAAGHYLIGLKGEIEEDTQGDPDASANSSDSESEHNSRTVLRTLHVELEPGSDGVPSEATVVRDFGRHIGGIHHRSQVVGNMMPGYNSHDLNKAEKLRVVVYVNRPFVFAFLFRLRTDSLAWDSLYRSLHYQLAPLKKSLVTSTKYRPERQDAKGSPDGIYNLVWDPPSLTVHSTIPNIPELASSDAWSRADAINTHLHLLNIHAATRARPGDLERTHKTNRGWWIVWTRLLQQRGRGDDARAANLSTIHESSPGASEAGGSNAGDEDDDGGDGDNNDGGGKGDADDVAKEIFLIRRASDHAGLRGVATGAGGGADGAGKLAQGIGVDTRRYVEELLSLL